MSLSRQSNVVLAMYPHGAEDRSQFAAGGDRGELSHAMITQRVEHGFHVGGHVCLAARIPSCSCVTLVAGVENSSVGHHSSHLHLSEAAQIDGA